MRPIKSRLSTDKIEKTALNMIEKNGLPSFSMRGLAQKLKVEPMSLYYYYQSRLDLLNAILDRILSEMTFLDKNHSWQKRLEHSALEWRKMGHNYPNFYQFLMVHRMNTKTGLTVLHSILEIFIDAGLSKEQAARYFRTIGYYLMGATLDETAGYSNGPSATKVLPIEEEKKLFPLVFEVGEFFIANQREKTFNLGLSTFIKTIELELAAK